MRDESAPDDLLRRLRDVLREAGYTEDGVRARLGPGAARGEARRVLLARRLAGSGREETLVRLFAAALPAARSAAEHALAPVGLDELAAAGLVALDGDHVRALVRIAPYDDLLLAFDADAFGAERPDYVTGLNPSANALAVLTIRRGVGTTLDLGTGCGIQALLAARHSGLVTATDVNPRALAFLRLNARLNGIDGIEPVEGNWLEPVRGRRFELIVANPPYVVSPESTHLYRDGGLAGDGVSRLVIEQLPEHLEEGGVAQVLCNWGHRADDDWRAPVEEWVRGRGVDALLLRYESVDPLDYAAGWNQPLEGDPAAYGAAIDRWLAYDAELGIERLSWGLVVLRRRSGGRNRVRAVEVPGRPAAGAGAQLGRMLDAWDAPLGDDDVLRPAAGSELIRRDAAGAAGGAPGSIRFHPAPTIGFDVPLDRATAAALARCDGTTNVAGALAGLDAPDRERAHAGLRRLFDLGCLEPVRKTDASAGVL